MRWNDRKVENIAYVPKIQMILVINTSLTTSRSNAQTMEMAPANPTI